MLKWIILLAAAWFGWSWGRLIVRRLRLAAQLKKTCARLKLRLRWVRPRLASLFAGRGEIDFTVDDRICVTILTTRHRKAMYRLTDAVIELVKIDRRYTSVKSPTRVLMRGENGVKSVGSIPHRLTQADLPDGAAKVAIVHPMPADVADCRGSTARSIGRGDELPGGFQFNTRTHFFERLEDYAKTGDLSVWMPRKPGRE